MAFCVIIAPTNQKTEDEHAEDGTDKPAQQHRQVFANGVILPDKAVPLFIESHTWLWVTRCSYYPGHALATMRILTESRQVEALGDVETVVQIQLVGHLLEGTAMTTFTVYTIESQIVMDHLVAHDIGELLLGKVVIVGNGDDGVIDVLVEPSALVVLEIAAGVFGGEQEIEIGSRKFSPEVFRVTLLENHWHIIVIGYHITMLKTMKINRDLLNSLDESLGIRKLS